MSTRTWSVGELARATGLTARALRHYDDIGLVVPSGRTPAGHRRYASADVRRLHRVLALRGFGFGLPEIATLLAKGGGEGYDGGAPGGPDPDVRELLLRQLDQVADRIARARVLERRLTMVLGQFDDRGEQSAAMLVSLMEGMIAVEHVYTPEELEHLAAARREAFEQLSPGERVALAERRRAAWEAMTPEQRQTLIDSRPAVPR